jgi:hypothetical protein
MSLLDNIFVNLRVLSKIPEGGRISTTGTGQIKLEDTKSLGGWVATGRRKITGDSREETVKLLLQLVNDVTLISDNIINSLILSQTGEQQHTGIGLFNENSKKCHQLNKLCEMLKNGKKGILNLHRTTYSDDINITAKLDEILDRMNQQHERISHVLEYVNISHTREIEVLRGRNGHALALPIIAPAAAAAAPAPVAQTTAKSDNRSDTSDDESDRLGDIF